MNQIKSLADILDIERTPIAERGWPNSSYELLRQAAERWPQRPALTEIGDPSRFTASHQLTFRALLGGVNQMANLLAELGIAPGGVTAYLLPNLIDTHLTLWGAAAAGIAFPLSPLLSADHLVALLNEGKVQVLVTAPGAPDVEWGGWETLRPHLRNCPTLRHVLLTAANGSPLAATAAAPEPGELFSVNLLRTELARQEPSRLISDRVFRPGDASSYFCTGGTTGLPKIAIRTHGAEAVNAAMLASMLGGELDEGSRSLCGLPLFHVNAAMVTGLTTWFGGGEVVLAGRGYRDPAVMKNFWAIVAHYRINFFSAVPTILSNLLQYPITADASSLKFVICGAAPMATELFNRFEDATGLKILEGYGLTESMCTASVNPIRGERRVGSIGLRMPYQDMAAFVLDDAGQYQRDCAIEEVGAIVLSGPNLFQGYTDPAHEQGIWIDRGDGHLWMNTGDMGRQDRDGYWWLTGRRKELIIRGGHNIDPRLIEEAMHRHPAVDLAAAVGRPDAVLGEIPVVYVQLRPGLKVGPDELQAYAAREISDRAAVPKVVIVLPVLPTTAVGKLSKIALVNREIQRTIEQEAEQSNAEIADVVVGPTSSGTVARIQIVGETENLAKRLRAYGFKTEISRAPSPQQDR